MTPTRSTFKWGMMVEKHNNQKCDACEILLNALYHYLFICLFTWFPWDFRELKIMIIIQGFSIVNTKICPLETKMHQVSDDMDSTDVNHDKKST